MTRNRETVKKEGRQVGSGPPRSRRWSQVPSPRSPSVTSCLCKQVQPAPHGVFAEGCGSLLGYGVKSGAQAGGTGSGLDLGIDPDDNDQCEAGIGSD